MIDEQMSLQENFLHLINYQLNLNLSAADIELNPVLEAITGTNTPVEDSAFTPNTIARITRITGKLKLEQISYHRLSIAKILAKKYPTRPVLPSSLNDSEVLATWVSTHLGIHKDQITVSYDDTHKAISVAVNDENNLLYRPDTAVFYTEDNTYTQTGYIVGYGADMHPLPSSVYTLGTIAPVEEKLTINKDGLVVPAFKLGFDRIKTEDNSTQAFKSRWMIAKTSDYDIHDETKYPTITVDDSGSIHYRFDTTHYNVLTNDLYPEENKRSPLLSRLSPQPARVHLKDGKIDYSESKDVMTPWHKKDKTTLELTSHKFTGDVNPSLFALTEDFGYYDYTGVTLVEDGWVNNGYVIKDTENTKTTITDNQDEIKVIYLKGHYYAPVDLSGTSADREEREIKSEIYIDEDGLPELEAVVDDNGVVTIKVHGRTPLDNAKYSLVQDY